MTPEAQQIAQWCREMAENTAEKGAFHDGVRYALRMIGGAILEGRHTGTVVENLASQLADEVVRVGQERDAAKAMVQPLEVLLVEAEELLRNANTESYDWNERVSAFLERIE